MTIVRILRPALGALCVLAACTSAPSNQVITGHIDTAKGALAVRAVADGEVVTAAPVRTDGSFTITVPAGKQYRLEVLTRTGTKSFVQRSGGTLHDVAFRVCQPVEPFDCGGVGDPGMGGGGGGMCGPNDPNCPPPPKCDPSDPTCMCTPDGYCCSADDPTCQPPPPPCTDPSDPNCPPPPCMDPTDPNCQPPPPCDPTTDPMCKCNADGTCCGPNDPNCPPPPPPCMDPTDPNCQPPPNCDPATDPMCKCDANGNCGMCTDPNDPTCMGGCYPDGTCPPPPCMDPNDPGCAPPCEDPMDPTSCKDPCANDPTTCGCSMDDPNCWPQPQPCCDANGTCDPSMGMQPDNAPSDFGCQ